MVFKKLLLVIKDSNIQKENTLVKKGIFTI